MAKKKSILKKSLELLTASISLKISTEASAHNVAWHKNTISCLASLTTMLQTGRKIYRRSTTPPTRGTNLL